MERHREQSAGRRAPPPPPRRTRLSSSFAPNLTQLRLILPHKSFTNPQSFPHLNVLLEFLTRKCNKFDVSARAGRPIYKNTKIRNLHNHVLLSYRQLGLGLTYKRTKVRASAKCRALVVICPISPVCTNIIRECDDLPRRKKKTKDETPPHILLAPRRRRYSLYKLGL